MNAYNRILLTSISTFFRVAFILLIILLLIYMILDVVQIFFPVTIKGIGMPFFFLSTSLGINVSIGQKEYAALAMAGQGMIVLKESPLVVPSINYLSSLIVLAFYLFIVRNVKLIVKSLKTNDIFTLINPKRFRNIAFLMLSSYLLNLVYQLIFNLYLKNSFHSTDIKLADWYVMDYQIGLIVSILFMFFISAVFKVGTDIAEENKSFI